MREMLLSKLPPGNLSKRYARIGAQWHALRLELRARPHGDRAIFDRLTLELRDLSRKLDLPTTDRDDAHITRVGDNRAFLAEPVAGVTGRLGHLPPLERVCGRILGRQWHEADTNKLTMAP